MTKTELKKIQARLDEVQKGCSVRTLDLNDVIEGTKKAEQEMDMLGILKKHRKGTKLRIQNPLTKKVASSYNGITRTTEVVLEHNGRNWEHTFINRMIAQHYGNIQMRFTIEGLENILNKAQGWR
jgi:uncharacterized protein (DUF305 family)